MNIITNDIKFIFLILFLVIYPDISNSQIINSSNKEKNNEKLQLVEGNTFISSNYIFPNNEGLNKPIGVKVNSVTKEIIVLDYGNNCLYMFTLEGKFIRKIGTPGQGPGDLLRPKYLFIDSEGDLYIYEDMNRRISIFSKVGKFINSFRLPPGIRRDFKFFVSNSKEIITNIPDRGYYFTIFSKKGEIIKEIGNIEIKNKDKFINSLGSQGIPFKNDNENIYNIFLPNMLLIKSYDENGNKLYDYPYNEIIENPIIKKSYLEIEKLDRPTFMVFQIDVIYKYNNYYIMSVFNYKKDSIIVLDNKLKMINKYFLKIDRNKYEVKLIDLITIFFDIYKLENSINIYIPFANCSEIIIYKLK